MNERLYRWMQINPLLRYAMLLVGTAIFLLLCGLLLLRPQRLELDVQRRALEQQQQNLQQRQRQLALNPSSETLQQHLTHILAQLHPDSSTSALELILATRGPQLAQWQPEAQPRSLTLHLQWPQFQPLFAELAQAAAPFPHRFQLLAQPSYLAVELWLEHEDVS